MLGKGADAAPAVVDLLEKLGVWPMMLVLVETDVDGDATEVSLETLTFVRGPLGGGDGVTSTRSWSAPCPTSVREQLGAYGVRACTTSPATRPRRLPRRRLGRGRRGGARGRRLGRGGGRRHPARQRGMAHVAARARRRDGRQRVVVRGPVAVRR